MIRCYFDYNAMHFFEVSFFWIFRKQEREMFDVDFVNFQRLLFGRRFCYKRLTIVLLKEGSCEENFVR